MTVRGIQKGELNIFVSHKENQRGDRKQGKRCLRLAG